MKPKDDSARSRRRCDWAAGDRILIEYHDTEWGTPQHDDRKLFEFLVLEGAQAGLSWLTILRRREGYREAFDRFDEDKVARYDSKKVRSLLADDRIIRNRLKISAAIENAKAFRAVQAEFGSFDAFIWQFVDGRPIVNAWRSMEQIPARTTESERMSQALRNRGFRFVGPTICYAHMQACGLVDDHVVSCFRHTSKCEATSMKSDRVAPRK